METGTDPTADAGGTAGPPLTREAVEHDVIEVLELDRATVSGDTDLLDYGLDSIRAMYLVDKWQSQGVDIQFLELVEESTLDAWWKAIEAKMEEARSA